MLVYIGDGGIEETRQRKDTALANVLKREHPCSEGGGGISFQLSSSRLWWNSRSVHRLQLSDDVGMDARLFILFPRNLTEDHK